MYVARLQGTEKQRRWAETIRMQVLHAIGYKRSSYPDLSYRLAWLYAVPSSSWWINNRHVSPDAIIHNLEMKPTRLRYYDLYTSAGVSAWSQEMFNAIIIDTETTGLGEDAEIVELAVIDLEGQTLMNTLLRPKGGIPGEATAVHGITNAMVANAPTFSDVWPSLRALLCLHRVVIYNARYDVRIIKSLASQEALPCPTLKVDCAMTAYASYRRIEDERGGYKWHKLEKACEELGVQIEGTSHRALSDCQATLDVIRRLRDACEQKAEYEWMTEEPTDQAEELWPELVREEL